LLGQRRLIAATRKDQANLAVDYGLLTEETSAILVRYRASDYRAEVLPEIVSVPQMVSEGMLDRSMFSLRGAMSTGFRSKSVFPSRIFDDTDRSPLSLKHPNFEEKVSSEPAVEPRIEVQVLPAIPADRIKEVVLALCPILAAAYLTRSRTNPNLETVVHALPYHLREDAVELLKSLGIWPSDKFESSIALFLATVRLATIPALSDDEEARIPLLLVELQARGSTKFLLHIELETLVESGLPEREACVPARVDRDTCPPRAPPKLCVSWFNYRISFAWYEFCF